MSNRAPERIAAAVAGLALAGVAAYGLALVALLAAISAQAPDPTVTDGDPCCGHPDTWGEVFWGAAEAVAVAVVVALLAGCALALLTYAARARWPRAGRRLALLPATIVGGAVAAMAIMIVPALGDGRSRIDCDAYRFDRGKWAAGGDGRRDQARALDRCDTLDGATPARVRALLGRPAYVGPAIDGRRWWGYRVLDVTFHDDRAEIATTP